MTLFKVCLSDTHFYCNFDGIIVNNQCGGLTNSIVPSGPFFSNVQNDAITGSAPSLTITDVSSICKLIIYIWLITFLLIKIKI